MGDFELPLILFSTRSGVSAMPVLPCDHAEPSPFGLSKARLIPRLKLMEYPQIQLHRGRE